MRLVLSVLILFGSALCAAAQAQDPAGRPFPVKPIRLVVGFPAGGPNDTQARLIGQKIGESMGQPVVVDNRPGADGIIGADLVAKSPADGYTLILVSAGHAINPNFHKLPYHPSEDFVPIAQVSRSPFVLVVHPSLPVRSVREMIKFAKARPGELNYGSAGRGSSLQLAMELFMSMAGVGMVHVPYKGGAPATTDLIAGRVQVMMNNIVSTLPPARSGKLRALAVTTAQRFVTTPELPTVAESLPGYEVNAWYGILGPRAMPAAIAARLNSEISKAIALPEIRQRLLALGLEPVGGISGEFRIHINAELARWARVVRDNNIRID